MPGVEDVIRDVAGHASRTAHRRPTSSARDFFAFVRSHIRTDRGAFSFDGYRPLREIAEVVCRNDARRVDMVKPTQCGYTTLFGFGYPLWQAIRNDRNVGYFVPTDDMATAMLKTRLRAALDGSGLDVEPTSSDGIVTVGPGDRRILWLGLTSVHNAISWPLDVEVLDEVDDLNQEHMALARERLDGSDYGHEIAFARSRYPGEGIHGRYLEGDQRRWVVQCPACKHEHIPADSFPQNVAMVDGAWTRACPGCHRALDFERHGRFVATRPDAPSISFQVSVLAFGKTDIPRIMAEWEQAQGNRKKIALFRGSKLALPDAGDRQALTAEDLMRATAPGAEITVPPLFVGVDVGDICHISGSGQLGETLAFSFFDKVRGEDLLERLDALESEIRCMGRAGITGLLIDQKPEGSLARAVCRRFPGRARLQEFKAVEKESEKDLEGERFDRMEFEREDTLEHFCDRVKASTILFPDRWQGVPFAQSEPGSHILTGSQKDESAGRLGLTVRKFRSGSVLNHYFMSSVFAMHVATRAVGLETAIQTARTGPLRAPAGLGQDVTSIMRELLDAR